MIPMNQTGRAPSIMFWVPMALNPEANQGPLLEIFISEPAGVFLAQKSDATIAYWGKRVEAVTWYPSRLGWQNEARSDSQSDPGVVLDAKVIRKKLIYENRTPRNNGTIFATAWHSTDERKSYHTQHMLSSCRDDSAGTKLVQLVPYDLSAHAKITIWPPKEIPALLDLAKVERVSAEYQRVCYRLNSPSTCQIGRVVNMPAVYI
jgi:hypothetical protein